MFNSMDFPETVEEFMEEYKQVDTKEVYSNGIEYVPIFRMKQWFEHVENKKQLRRKGEWIETAQDYYETVNKKDGGVNENTEYFTDDIACSECLTKFSNIDNETERFNFCPNCGADMRNGEDELTVTLELTITEEQKQRLDKYKADMRGEDE